MQATSRVLTFEQESDGQRWNSRVMVEIDKAEELGQLVDGPTSVAASGVKAQLEIIHAASLLRFAAEVINVELCAEFFERCQSWLKRNGEEDGVHIPELESWLILRMLNCGDDES